LDVDYMIVDSNEVMMLIGGGLTSGQIIWRPEEDGSSYKLIAGYPERRTPYRVFYRRETAMSANTGKGGPYSHEPSGK
jgi:hypothetical protein